MTEPTEEQIKRLWEWCGGVLLTENYNTGEPEHFYMLDGGAIYPIVKINLNNLFKYAVPKLHDRLAKYEVMHLLKDWVEAVVIHGKAPALALFWVINKVIDK